MYRSGVPFPALSTEGLRRCSRDCATSAKARNVRQADLTDECNEGLSPALVANDPEKAHKVLA